MTPEQFEKLADQGHNRIPLMCEVLADLGVEIVTQDGSFAAGGAAAADRATDRTATIAPDSVTASTPAIASRSSRRFSRPTSRRSSP